MEAETEFLPTAPHPQAPGCPLTTARNATRQGSGENSRRLSELQT